MTWPQLIKVAEDVTSATLSELPPPVRKHLADVPIVMEKHPSQEDVESGIEPDTLGYFDEDGAGLVRIRLWLENILDFAEHDAEIFRDEVRTTLLHEIGHVLGWDEEDVEDRGLG